MNSYAFAQISQLLTMTAFAVYAVAFVLWCVDLANRRDRTEKRREAKSAVAGSRADSGSRAGSRADSGSRAESGSRAGAGSGAESGGGSVAVLDRDEPDPSSPRGGGAVAGRSGRPHAGSPRPGASRPLGSLALILTTIAFVAHVGTIAFRALATQRPPWGNMYEFALAGTALTILAFLVLAWRRADLRVLGTFVVGPVLLFQMIASTQWYVPADELMPALQNSEWLFIHVSLAILGSGLFALGAAVTLLQLLRARSEQKLLAGTGGAGFLSALPSARELESIAFRINAVGFVMWTFTLIAGAIWAQYAWGRFWNWDPKEVWTFIVWVVYAAYLHARTTRGFRGTRAAWFSLVGFACMVFNFTGVNLIFGGLHSYAGV